MNPVRRATAVSIALLVLGASATVAHAVFQRTRTVPSNAFSTAADWMPPVVSASAIGKSAGGSAGYIKQGGSYYVYANVADSGNPADGVSSVTANVSSFTTGQTTAALTAGSYTADGVSYNYRTAALTADVLLGAGAYNYSIIATDAGDRSSTLSGLGVTVDNTAPSASDVQTANGGIIAGRADIGDTITFTFSEPIDPTTILSGWTGTSTSVVVRLNQVITNDTVTIFNAANTSQLPLGTVTLGRTDYVSSNRTFGASGTASTMVMSGSTIAITLGTQSGAASTAGGTGTMTWTPSLTPTDRAGNGCSLTVPTESGAADKEF